MTTWLTRITVCKIRLPDSLELQSARYDYLTHLNYSLQDMTTWLTRITVCKIWLPDSLELQSARYDYLTHLNYSLQDMTTWLTRITVCKIWLPDSLELQSARYDYLTHMVCGLWVSSTLRYVHWAWPDNEANLQHQCHWTTRSHDTEVETQVLHVHCLLPAAAEFSVKDRQQELLSLCSRKERF